MGIFDIFKKKTKVENDGIVSPTNGELLELASVPDAVFSQKMMGDGFAIKSTDGEIVSPVNGTVEMVFETKHAVGLKAENGLEILIHLGVDTVNLKGEGFEVFVKAGDKIKSGDRLIKMDVDFIQKNAKSDISPIIFTNLQDDQYINVVTGAVKAKEENRVKVIKK